MHFWTENVKFGWFSNLFSMTKNKLPMKYLHSFDLLKISIPLPMICNFDEFRQRNHYLHFLRTVLMITTCIVDVWKYENLFCNLCANVFYSTALYTCTVFLRTVRYSCAAISIFGTGWTLKCIIFIFYNEQLPNFENIDAMQSFGIPTDTSNFHLKWLECDLIYQKIF